MAPNRLRLLVDCWKGRPAKPPPGESRHSGQRCAQLWTVQTTLLLVIVLVGGVLLLDSYKWRRFSFPWSSGGPYKVLNHEALSADGGHEAGAFRNFSIPDAKQPPRPSISSSSPREFQSPASSTPPLDLQTFPVALMDAVPHPLPLQTPKMRPVLLSALDKLEYGLAQARYAIRKAFLAAKNGTHSETAPGKEHYEPHGDVYRNAATFRQSYQEMERRFQIFVYSEGEEPLVHNGPCKEIYAIEGRFIQELQGENPFVTSDPNKAHVFFLPFSVAMMVTYLYEMESGDMDPLRLFVGDYVDVLRHKYTFWNRSGGADHFMLSCHDWGPAITRSNMDLGEKAIRVLCNANASEGYIPWKDASLPEIHLVGGHVPTPLGGASTQERPHLAFFAGRDHGPVRPQLFEHWEGKDKDVMVYQWLPTHLNYHKLMKTSRFCLCPGGYEVNSPRIVEAIYNECVPVIIADSFVLPFSDILNWDAFSLHVQEKDIPKLKMILQNVTLERHAAMQDKVSQVQRHFLLHQPPKKYDVFHMILHSVWLRRLNIRVQGS